MLNSPQNSRYPWRRNGEQVICIEPAEAQRICATAESFGAITTEELSRMCDRAFRVRLPFRTPMNESVDARMIFIRVKGDPANDFLIFEEHREEKGSMRNYYSSFYHVSELLEQRQHWASWVPIELHDLNHDGTPEILIRYEPRVDCWSDVDHWIDVLAYTTDANDYLLANEQFPAYFKTRMDFYATRMNDSSPLRYCTEHGRKMAREELRRNYARAKLLSSMKLKPNPENASKPIETGHFHFKDEDGNDIWVITVGDHSIRYSYRIARDNSEGGGVAWRSLPLNGDGRNILIDEAKREIRTKSYLEWQERCVVEFLIDQDLSNPSVVQFRSSCRLPYKTMYRMTDPAQPNK